MSHLFLSEFFLPLIFFQKDFCQNFFPPEFFFCLIFFPPNICLPPEFLFDNFVCKIIFLARKTQLGQKGLTFAAKGCSPPQELIIFKLNEPAFWRKHWLNLKSNYNIVNLPITVSQKIKLHFEVRNFINWGTGGEVGQQWNSLEQS